MSHSGREGANPVTFLKLNSRGLASASLAALLWGFVPVYSGAVGVVDPIELVVHRALWSAVILLFMLICLPRLTGGLKADRAALATPALRRGFVLSCALLSVASLLFYINPTTQLLIGVFYFGAAFPLREAFVFGLIWTGLVVYFATRRSPSGP